MNNQNKLGWVGTYVSLTREYSMTFLLLLVGGLGATDPNRPAYDDPFICIKYHGNPAGVYDPIANWDSKLGGGSYVWRGG